MKNGRHKACRWFHDIKDNELSFGFPGFQGHAGRLGQGGFFDGCLGEFARERVGDDNLDWRVAIGWSRRYDGNGHAAIRDQCVSAGVVFEDVLIFAFIFVDVGCVPTA